MTAMATTSNAAYWVKVQQIAERYWVVVDSKYHSLAFNYERTAHDYAAALLEEAADARAGVCPICHGQGYDDTPGQNNGRVECWGCAGQGTAAAYQHLRDTQH